MDSNNNNNNNKDNKLIVLNTLFGIGRRRYRKHVVLFCSFVVMLMLMWLRQKKWFIMMLSYVLPSSMLQWIDVNHHILKSSPTKDRKNNKPYNNTSNNNNNLISNSPKSPSQYQYQSHDPINNSFTRSTSTTHTTRIKSAPRIQFNQLHKKKVTLSTIDTVYYEHITDRKVCNFTLIESERDTLLRLASTADLYLLTQITDDNEEEMVINLLKSYGIFEAGLNPHKVLFCSTTQGRAHIARHLESILHIDDDLTALTMLKPHVQFLTFIFDINAETTTTTTTTTTTSSNTTILSTTTTSNSIIQEQDQNRITTCKTLHDYFINIF
ncbi:splicing factor [Heterostelium album PN500]|uniref:Splicing factor n=1 Tax=Heterostelium pallidum (strain ATCC 26659 / Pp 5 / PN500) TaxID=670386 RepID=D3B166_HETP5|nr:splicing factor [Heterostelium album PN500]EFA85040.1 splicing factor [Heterostelium album PN500]|eukprot:XP_020437150.1 splicing factor [Heterostelium album PN500]